MKKKLSFFLAGILIFSCPAVASAKSIFVYNGMKTETDYTNALFGPTGIAVTPDGEVLVCDTNKDSIEVFSGEETRSAKTTYGTAGVGGDTFSESGGYHDGSVENMLFSKPQGVLADSGVIIVADTGNNAIRKITGKQSRTIAGNGNAGYANGKDGSVMFNMPTALAADGKGNIYVADTMNHCIRKIDKDGNVSNFAGTPEKAGYADGELESAEFFEPSGLAIDKKGVLYVADTANHCIRRILNGEVSTIAGKPGTVDEDTGYSEGGYIDGAEALFNYPKSLAVSSDGSMIFVADTYNHVIRLIKDNTASTLLGSGRPENFHENIQNMGFTLPYGIAVNEHNLYISDSLNNSVLKIELSEELLEGRKSRHEMLGEIGDVEYSDTLRVYTNNKITRFPDVQPVKDTESLLLPIRFLAESLGFQVEWDKERHDVTLVSGTDKYVLKENYDFTIINDRSVMTEHQIARLLPFTVEWFPEKNVVIVVTD